MKTSILAACIGKVLITIFESKIGYITQYMIPYRNNNLEKYDYRNQCLKMIIDINIASWPLLVYPSYI